MGFEMIKFDPNIMSKVDSKGYYEDYLYIGHTPEDYFPNLKYRTKMMVKISEKGLHDLGWHPTFVKRWEWYMLTKTPYYKPKRYNLRRRL